MKKIEKKKITEEWFNVVRRNDMDAIKKMIGEGLDVNCKNQYRWAALHYACHSGNIELATFLIDNGADVNKKNKTGTAPLHLSCYWSDIDMIRLLLDNGADITARDDDGGTPLDDLRVSNPKRYQELLQWLSEEYPDKTLELMASENIQSKSVGL